jgi:hypothetical protein
MRMKRVAAGFAMASALAGLACAEGPNRTGAVEVHQAKQAYADFASWPMTSPGALPLANFQPFRAVYERHYRDVNGEHREDRVIVNAENVAWGSEAAIMVGLIDTGNLQYSDTNARSQVRFFSRADGRLLLQVTPAPGSAKDYRLIRAEDGRVSMSTVRTANGETDFQDMAAEVDGWGAPAHWVVASMALEPDMGVRLDPTFAFASSRVFVAEPFRVLGEESVEVLGERVRAWSVEYPIGLEGPRLMRTWVVNRPPYVLGRQPVDAETGEEPLIGSMRLVAFELYEDSR